MTQRPETSLCLQSVIENDHPTARLFEPMKRTIRMARCHRSAAIWRLLRILDLELEVLGDASTFHSRTCRSTYYLLQTKAFRNVFELLSLFRKPPMTVYLEVGERKFNMEMKLWSYQTWLWGRKRPCITRTWLAVCDINASDCSSVRWTTPSDRIEAISES